MGCRENLFAAKNLGKRFGAQWVFRGVEFEIPQGECLAVTGPNGSGKSTLLRILARLEHQTEGTFSVFDRPCMGWVAPDLNLYPPLTVYEHFLFAARLRSVQPKAEKLIEMVGLCGSETVPASALSTGMKTRLKLGLAVQHEPALLILDEPGSSLDAQGKAMLAEIVAEQKRRGFLILATNDPSELRFAEQELRLG
jgi:ABC-type multidrug transport system ATPase subunit